MKIVNSEKTQFLSITSRDFNDRFSIHPDFNGKKNGKVAQDSAC